MSEQAEPATPSAETFEFELDGVGYELPIALKGAFLRQSDYMRKTQELANRRRELEAEWQEQAPKPPTFRVELEALINHHSVESGSDTPDFILAGYLTGCLRVFEEASRARETWYGRAPQAAGQVNGPRPQPGAPGHLCDIEAVEEVPWYGERPQGQALVDAKMQLARLAQALAAAKAEIEAMKQDRGHEARRLQIEALRPRRTDCGRCRDDAPLRPLPPLAGAPQARCHRRGRFRPRVVRLRPAVDATA